MSQEGSTPSSVRNLPSGKLQNLKKLFEEKDAQASGATVFGASQPKTAAGRGRPMSTVTQNPKPISAPSTSQPKPAPRHGSPARKKGMGPDFEVLPTPVNLYTRPNSSANEGMLPQPRQHRASEKQEWETTTLERKAHKKLSPTVSRRVALFTGEGGDGEKNGSGGSKLGMDHRFVSPEARSGSPKRLSDPCTDTNEVASKRNSGERRRTVDNVSLGLSTESKAGDVKVSEQMKRFEGKPSLPRRPAVTAVGQNAPGVGSAEKNPGKSGGQSDTNYDTAWDIQPGKNIEQLKAISGDRSSAAVKVIAGDRSSAGVIRPSDQGVGKEITGSRISAPAAFSPPKGQVPRPSEQPPPPPSKPPRTFAHDDYLHIKIQGQPPDSQSAQTVTKGGQAEGVGYSISTVKERISLLIDGRGDKGEVTLGSGNKDKDAYSHLGQREKEVKGVRETPPSRPPPPRPRPISEGSTLSKDHAVSPGQSRDGSDSESEGPIVISLKHGRRINRQASVSGPHRNPGDRLPDTPDKADSLQRFPLRKSFSSECLYTGSLSSLPTLGSEEDPVQGSMMRSYHANNSGEPLYEALIDSEGYAVPHEFLRIQLDQDGDHTKVRTTNFMLF